MRCDCPWTAALSALIIGVWLGRYFSESWIAASSPGVAGKPVARSFSDWLSRVGISPPPAAVVNSWDRSSRTSARDIPGAELRASARANPLPASAAPTDRRHVGPDLFGSNVMLSLQKPSARRVLPPAGA